MTFDSAARDALITIVSKYGVDVVNDDSRCRALLNDFCPTLEHERYLLSASLSLRPFKRLLYNDPDSYQTQFELMALEIALRDKCGMRDDAAKWVANSWGHALGILKSDESAGLLNDVSGLRAHSVGDAILWRWDWPVAVEYVLIVIRNDRFAQSPLEVGGERRVLSRDRYERDGGYEVSIVGRTHFFLTVFSARKEGKNWKYSLGITLGCRYKFATDRITRIWYSTRAKRHLGVFPSGAHLLRVDVDANGTLPAMTLVVKQGGIPISLKNGKEVIWIPAGTECDPGSGCEWEFLSSDLPRRWRARLFTTNEDDAQHYQLIPRI